AAYLAISIALTVIVASALSRSGRVYLAHAFGGDEVMAGGGNRGPGGRCRLLRPCFPGPGLRAPGRRAAAGRGGGVRSVKVGEELLVLGALHLVNMVFFTRFRRRQEARGRGAAGADRRGAAAWPRAATVAGQPGGTAPRPPAAPAREVLH